MEHFQLPEPLGKKLEHIAKEVGMSEQACAQEAVLRFIEDFEDVRDAEHVLADPNRKTYTTEEVTAFLRRDK